MMNLRSLLMIIVLTFLLVGCGQATNSGHTIDVSEETQQEISEIIDNLDESVIK